MEKLIRDLLPKKYNIQVRQCIGNDEYCNFLAQKLLEETNEVRQAFYNATHSEDDETFMLIEELADLKEVFDSFLDALGIDPKCVKEYQRAKNLLNGSFKQGYILVDKPEETE